MNHIFFFLDQKPPAEWPSNGEITFVHFYLRYSKDTQFVIKDLNVNIQPMEKVIIPTDINYVLTALVLYRPVPVAIFTLIFRASNNFHPQLLQYHCPFVTILR